MAKKLSPQVRDHLEWLGFIQPTGLVVSAHAVVQAGAILNRRDVEGQELLKECVEERTFDPDREPEPYLPDFEVFARRVLGWSFSHKGYAGTDLAPVPEELELALPEYGETLRPDFAVRERYPGEGRPPWQLLVQVLETGTDLDRVVFKKGGLEASPHGRLERLLRGTHVSAGLLFNGSVIRLISAPRGESSGWMDFRVNDMLPTAGRPLCAALRLLLSETRLLSLPKDQRLAGLLEASRKYQNVVSERLAEQVLHGLYELLRGIQSAHEKSHGTLLAHELEQDPDNVYRALLTVILRLVFLLYAEERGMLSDDDTFVHYYSIVGLYERLREDAGLHPDTMDDRYGSWAQLLVLFRMVHDGAKCGNMRLPARRGDLFSPSRFPFLEGWHGSGAPQVTQAIEPPLVPDGTVYRVLEKLLVLDGERISYRALDVEQIGSVYETMMGFRLEKATGRSVAIRSQKRGGASTTIDLDALLDVAPTGRAKWIRDRTERKLTATVTNPLKTANNLTDLHAALGRVVDSPATPDLVPPGAMILQPSDERRRSGSHYTPRELTAPIVEKALEPILDRLGNGGATRADDLLDLKICDPAMGSGAFLVETCRFLADRLVEAWKVHGGRPDVPHGDDELIFARRVIAQRCLYGVDRNPMAVDLAKMSLWLATFAKDEPLTFVDHALRDGDSLVGLTRRQIAAFTWKSGALPPQLELNTRVVDAVDRVAAIRRKIQEAGPEVPHWELEEKLKKTDQVLQDVRFFGDLATEAYFMGRTARNREMIRQRHLQDLQDREDLLHRARLDKNRKKDPPFTPFHWETEFPEVFGRKNPGFDAFVGNPPFLGGKRISATLGDGYRDWLATIHVGSSKNADLVAHFFRRAFSLLRRGGILGLIATNTISEGDTRSSGLKWICQNGGTVYSATRRVKWPGLAAVVVSVIHLAKGLCHGVIWLDGKSVGRITSFLYHSGGHDDPACLGANDGKSFVGSFLRGMGYTFSDIDNREVATPLAEMHHLIEQNPLNQRVLFPYVGGKEVSSDPTHAHYRYVIDFRDYPLRRTALHETWAGADEYQQRKWLGRGIVPLDYPGPVASDWPDLLGIVEKQVKPDRMMVKRKAHRIRWWHHGDNRPALYREISRMDRVLVTGAAAAKYHMIARLAARQVFSHKLIVFPLSSYAAFCALQARPHEIWSAAFGATFGTALTYNPSDVFQTFPFPHKWTADPTLEAAGQGYYEFRADLMVLNNEGLTKTYNRFHDPGERDPDIAELRRLHTAMDRAVLDAYGWTDIPTECEFLPEHEEDDEGSTSRRKKWYRYRWPDPVRDEVLGRLMELNAERAEEERRAAAEEARQR